MSIIDRIELENRIDKKIDIMIRMLIRTKRKSVVCVDNQRALLKRKCNVKRRRCCLAVNNNWKMVVILNKTRLHC